MKHFKILMLVWFTTSKMESRYSKFSHCAQFCLFSWHCFKIFSAIVACSSFILPSFFFKFFTQLKNSCADLSISIHIWIHPFYKNQEKTDLKLRWTSLKMFLLCCSFSFVSVFLFLFFKKNLHYLLHSPHTQYLKWLLI